MSGRTLGLGMAVALAAAACADENPTGLGADLVPGEVRTFELLLDASQFLVSDTTVGGFTGERDVGFVMVAREFGGALTANALVRFGALPSSVSYEDDEGTNQTDNDPTFVGGSLVLHVDSVAVHSPGTSTVRLSTVGEAWAPGPATWEVRRVDDDEAEQQWTQPGGTPGDLTFAGEWTIDADSIVIPVDSLAVATIFDQEDDARGALIQLETEGTRFRVTGVNFHLEAVPSGEPDIIAMAEVEPSNVLSVFHGPEPDLAEGELRAGGLNGWRTILNFNPRLDTLAVPCPGGPEGCVLRLSQHTISMAALVLEPLPLPVAFVPEDTLLVAPFVLLVSENIPPSRAPIGNHASPHGFLQPIEPDAFAQGTSRTDVSIPLTDFIANLTRERSESGDSPPSSLAVLTSRLQDITFGYGSFAGARTPEGSGAARPRLRLLVTTVSHGGLR